MLALNMCRTFIDKFLVGSFDIRSHSWFMFMIDKKKTIDKTKA